MGESDSPQVDIVPDTTSSSKDAGKLTDALTRLREQVHTQEREALMQRLRTDPEKTEEEQRLGVYLEEIEPQVRGAVRELNRKGFPTYSSGFWGHESEYQAIEGDFRLDEATVEILRGKGVEVTVEPSWKYSVEQQAGVAHPDTPEDAKFTTDIRFKPATADLQDIEQKWGEIATAFPDRGIPAVNWYREQTKIKGLD
ncbi:MAG TPA: hypothetical protein VG935_01635 [Patescibacteria group bacterium]|nr:hypothetical protein [Patescibacteria group bacterium]